MTLDKNRGLTLLHFRIYRKVRVIVSISTETDPWHRIESPDVDPHGFLTKV